MDKPFNSQPRKKLSQFRDRYVAPKITEFGSVGALTQAGSINLTEMAAQPGKGSPQRMI
jgi:hypothetical protein